MKRPESGLRVWFQPGAYTDMRAECELHVVEETGGVLLGWRSASDVMVTHVLGPGPDARHERAAFHPDALWQERRLAEVYEQSGRRLEYLGDWHTHPGGRPWPSRRDERTLRRIAAASEARCPDPVMVILAPPRPAEQDAWAAGVFALRRTRWSMRRHRAAPGEVLMLPGSPRGSG